MAQVALLGHAKRKREKIKTLASELLSDHAVANTWWCDPCTLHWQTEQCYVDQI